MSPTEDPNELQRSMKPSWVFAMALGSAVGWGAFILPFEWEISGGLAGTFIGFIIGGLVIATIAVSYGSVIEKLPVAGGSVAFALSGLGRLHGFIAGWCLTLGYTCIVALNASAVTLVFRVTLPGLVMRARLYSIAGWDIYLPEVIIAILFIVSFAYLNIRGIALSGQFQYFAVVLLLLGVGLIFMVCGILFFTRGITLPSAFPPGISPWKAVFTIIAFAPWAYVGFDSIPQLAGEFDFNPKKAFSLLMWGVFTATVIYLAMMVAVTIAVGENHDSYASDGWPTATAIAHLMGPIGLILMVIAVSMGVLTGLNGFYVSSSRVLLTMGRAHMIPRAFAQLNPKSKTPRNAILFVAALCLLSPWFGRSALLWIVDMTSVGISVAYFYTCYCAYKIGKTGYVFGMDKKVAPNARMKWFGLAGCVLALGFLALLLVPGSPGQLGVQPLSALIFWAVLGVIFYWIRRKSYFALTDEELHRAVYQS
ncbi:MAG: APC family permease [Rothia sp. (in: high G+C Gram-positive bacteria)]|nr:APC family permease [Rothia sp. (in: high G+C Gram-positive bacteria)]